MTPMLRTLAGMAVGQILGGLTALVTRPGHSAGTSGPASKLRSRRSFTRNAALAATGIVTAQITGGFVYLLWPNKTSGFGGTFPVSAANVPEVNGTPFRDPNGKFFLVHTEDGVEALYWKCVHLGCTVPWIDNQHQFVCPCHGSVYSYNGERVSGPAPRPLDAMPVEVDDNGNVTVDTNPNTLIERTEYSPEHTTPYPA
jgi:cytochrome b6-f complex iron-sulfur subunit